MPQRAGRGRICRGLCGVLLAARSRPARFVYGGRNGSLKPDEIVSDTLLQVDSIDACVTYALIGDIIRFSARSCVKEIRADELVGVITAGIGSGGGHMRKAAGVADLNQVFSPGGKVMLRTLEGDIDLTVNPGQLLMIGISGEAYPISRASFEKNYRLTGSDYVFSEDYIPAVRDYVNGKFADLSSMTKECTALGSTLVYAKRLTRRTHVFTIWDPQKYIYGKPGDWLAVRQDNPDDVYIIEADIFAATYSAV